MLKQYPTNGIWALGKAIIKHEGRAGALQRFLEQAVFAVVLIIALSAQVVTDIPYAPYLLLGLCSWFYLQESLTKSVALPHDFLPLLRMNGYHPFWLSFGIALSALPTLFIWMAAALLVSLLAGLPFAGYFFIPYIILVNFLNAVAQSLATSALAPLFPKLADAGLRITLSIFFWTTPIAFQSIPLGGIWDILAYFNPLYYLTNGMRGIVSGHFIPTATHAAIFIGLIIAVSAVGLTLMKLVWRRALRAV